MLHQPQTQDNGINDRQPTRMPKRSVTIQIGNDRAGFEDARPASAANPGFGPD